MKKIVLSSLIIITSFIIGCSKDSIIESELNEPNFEKISIQTSNWSAASNNLNPYDSVGYLHNFYLKEILANLNLSNSNTLNYDSFYSHATNYVQSNFTTSISTEFSQKFSKNFFEDYLNDYYSNGVPSPTKIVSKLAISNNAKDAVLDLINSIHNRTSMIFVYTDVKLDIINWETNIPNLSISNQEKITLLKYASILRYSLLAWENSYIDNGGSIQTFGLRSWFKSAWSWAGVAILDAGGIAAGILTANPIVGIVATAFLSGGGGAICHYNNW